MKNSIDKNNLSLRIAYIFESILAMVVLIAVFLGTIDALRMIWEIYIVDFQNPVEYSQLNDLLGQILLLVIGVELVVMLSLHLPGALCNSKEITFITKNCRYGRFTIRYNFYSRIVCY